MAKVSDAFCIDVYEASKPDADPFYEGLDESAATSVFGVLPWRVADNKTAETACNAAGKRLCTKDEWNIACVGPDNSSYAYGNVYDPFICNGIDAFEGGNFHLMPTGSFPDCTNEWGVFDLNGNLWEHTADGSDMTIRGGAYNCMDSATLHRCDYIPGDWTPSARGFRCCLSPKSSDPVHSDTAEDLQPTDTDNGQCSIDATDETKDTSLDTQNGLDSNTGIEIDSADSGSSPDIDTAQDTFTGSDSDEPTDPAIPSDTDIGSDVDSEKTSDTVLDTPTDSGADTTDDPERNSDSADTEGCPADMVKVEQFCMDRYEASRSDATATFQGQDNHVALSREGVLPWYVKPMTESAFAEFSAACEQAGKRLCSATEWFASCTGTDNRRYAFGNDWDPSICNSVDTYCETCCDILGLSDCVSGENCGYSSTLSASPYTPETCFITADYGPSTCPVCFHVMPTGAFSRCTNESGAFDVNGNVWEAASTPTTDDARGYRLLGGAFNCGSPSGRFRCTFNATWSALYAGFRCCKDKAIK